MREWIQEEHREHKMYAGADGEAIPEEFREARNKGLYYLQFSGKTENENKYGACRNSGDCFFRHVRYIKEI